MTDDGGAASESCRFACRVWQARAVRHIENHSLEGRYRMSNCILHRSLSAWTSLFTAALFVALLGAGCPTPTPPPALSAAVTVSPTSGNPPLAVLATATPSGGVAPYTFQWTSVPGGLIAVPTSASTNITYAIVGTYTVTCTITDSAAQTATGSALITVGTTPPPVTPRLFIANVTGNNITSYANPSTVNGNIPPDTNLAGANTQLNVPADIVVDASDALLAANNIGASITSYNDAANTNGNLTPNRNVQGANTQLVATGPASLAINPADSVLFVSEIGGAPKILIFTSVSTAGFTGNLAPTRVITNAAITQPIGINLDSVGNLYIANLATNTILVYANAANLNGNVAPTRTITGNPAFTSPFDVFVDTSDRMYVVNQVGGRVNTFNNASTLNGTVAPDFTLTVPGGTDLTAIAVDSAGRGYLVNRATNTIFSYNDIATLNGTRSPDRTIAGTNTLLSAPIRLFLVQ